MTLRLCQVAVCDECQEERVLHSSSRYEAMATLDAWHWRHVVRDKGKELLCGTCADKMDEDDIKAGERRAGGIRPEVELIRGRQRPGFAPCKGCGNLTAMADHYYLPFTEHHVTNLRCLVCCTRMAAIRGYRVDVEKYLPREEAPAPTEVQQVLPT